MNHPCCGEPKLRDQTILPVAASSAYTLPSPPPTNSRRARRSPSLTKPTAAVLVTPACGGTQSFFVSSPMNVCQTSSPVMGSFKGFLLPTECVPVHFHIHEAEGMD